MNRPVLSDAAIVTCAAAAAVGARFARPLPVALVAGALALAVMWPRPPVVVLAIALAASFVGARSLSGLHPTSVGPWRGPTVVLSEPSVRFGGVSLELRAAGKHLLAAADGDASNASMLSLPPSPSRSFRCG